MSADKYEAGHAHAAAARFYFFVSLTKSSEHPLRNRTPYDAPRLPETFA